jgi:hypothetical protein
MDIALSRDHTVETSDALRKIYGSPIPQALVKEIDHISPHYRAFIEASPFVALATSGAQGLDCSPRGDGPGFVRVHDARTLLIPDRPGNNRIDSMENLICDPRVALLFLIPGVSVTIRVVGRATISADPAIAQSFSVNGKQPRTVLVVSVQSAFFQCAKAIVRSRLWEPNSYVDPQRLPTVGTMLAEFSNGNLGGESYDRATPERIKKQLY